MNQHLCWELDTMVKILKAPHITNNCEHNQCACAWRKYCANARLCSNYRPSSKLNFHVNSCIGWKRFIHYNTWDWMMARTISMKLQDGKSILVTYFVKGKISMGIGGHMIAISFMAIMFFNMASNWILWKFWILNICPQRLASMAILCPPGWKLFSFQPMPSLKFMGWSYLWARIFVFFSFVCLYLVVNFSNESNFRSHFA